MLFKVKTVIDVLSCEWTLALYEEYQEYFSQNDLSEINSIISYCEKLNYKNDFKWAVEVGTIQYLIGVFPKSKEILVCSKQLSFELSMIDIYESNESDLGLYEKFKKHAQRVASLPIENSPTQIEYISFRDELPLFSAESFQEVHEHAKNIEAVLVDKVSEYKQNLFEKISDFGLSLTANYMLVRIHLLKFLAILPSLDHDVKGVEVKRIFLETFRRLVEDSQVAKEKGYKGQKRHLPNLYIYAFKLAQAVGNILPSSTLAYLIRFSVALMAQRFIAGETIEKAKNSLQELLATNRTATIDQLGELVVSNQEADLYTSKVLEIINGFNEHVTKGSKNYAGINNGHVSIKVSALSNDFKPQDYAYNYKQVEPRLKKILLAGKEQDVFINIDAEHYHYRDTVLQIYAQVLLTTEELKNYAQTGIVVQAYLRDGYKHFCDVLELAKKRGICMPIRLVKGAYWDAETIEAEAHNFNAPQFLNKDETDLHFRQVIYKCLENGQHIQLAVASHNIQDHCFAEALKAKMFQDAPVIEHQCLHMTYEALSYGMSKMSWPTRNYIPVGNLLVGMAYLVRRIMENSSQVGVLTIMRSHKLKGISQTPLERWQKKKENNELEYDYSINTLTKEFKNTFPIRTYLDEHMNRVKESVNDLTDDLNQGDLIYSGGDYSLVSSSDPSLKIGEITYDSKEQVDKKIEELFEGHGSSFWNLNCAKRYAVLYKLADLLLQKREELTAIIMFEAGKTVDEAIADVDEAVDFVNFYIKEQVKIDQNSGHEARGVIGVIAPWNFPLAIPCGMTVAALVAGNSAILKPAEQTSLIALKFVDLCYEAGIPKEILQISLGAAEVGSAIVDHELTSGIVFTGSKAVGEMIYKKLSGQLTSARYKFSPIPKMVITEMGGKNAIIVTNNSELDETVSGVIYAAFAHSGQKCSAASRVIIDNELKDAFIERFIAAVNDTKVGSALDYSSVINPLITQEDQLRVRELAKRAASEVKSFGGAIHLDNSAVDYVGYCVGASVFEVSRETALNEDTMASNEVFGPMIHVVGYDTLDEALELFNSTDYALTGGIYCQSQDDIDYLMPKMNAGNIYINRPNTGARVGIEPFGGFKMSGTGPKAGSIDYLSHFNKAKNTDAMIEADFNLSLEEIESFDVTSSQRLYISRKEQVINILSTAVERFEIYFEVITEANKTKLAELKKQIVDDCYDVQSLEFPNTFIPGQVSYSKKDLTIGSGIVIDMGTKVTQDLFVEVLLNLLLGNGISLITTNDQIYGKWEKLSKLFRLSGVSENNFTLSLLTEENVNKVLKENDYHFVLFGNQFYKKEIMNYAYARDFSDRLVKVYMSREFMHPADFLNRYTHTRSFAINTIRHGAPLDLTL